ncbi:rRNA maturation RNase YbeY [Candidatus Campbellbacteria bacterium]|nr:MAG: rRNA maturation RNase YbeY [Candidatus Campbellbacteria bacterium]
MATHCTTTLKSTAPLSIQKEGRVFARVAEDVLGLSYELTIVFIGDTFSKRLNTTYRDKHKSTNVLAFPLSKTSGELYINIPCARREAARFESTILEHVHFLFIHGLLHLKGYDHSPTMEHLEQQYMKKYF